MTVGEYILDKLQAFGPTPALAEELTAEGVDLSATLDASTLPAAGAAMCRALGWLLLAPRRTSVSEGGFSMSWDWGQAAKLYLWLCRRWDVAPDPGLQTLLGVSSIKDTSRLW